MNVIETKSLTKYYGKIRGIEDVNLDVQDGEIFGFIGPNGAGKSTTIRTLLGLIYPTRGSATIFGKNILKYGPEIKENVGYLPSEVFYYDDMKAIDLLEYSASFYRKNHSRMIARIHELAEIMNLDLTKKIDDLSYGNRKKVGIIQGLLHEPKLIILDEPTGGLDPLMQQKFFELLKNENQKGATVLFSSHILNEVQKLCSRVAIIKDGKIIKLETMNNLREHSYKKVRLEIAVSFSDDYFNFEGVSNLKVEGNMVSFLYRGDVNLVIRKIAAVDLVNFWVEEPDLEEIFLHYYL